MGALVSLPFLPVSLVGNWAASCCGAAICSGFCSPSVNPLLKTFQSSVATRITYAVFFLVNSIISWVSLSNFLTKRLEKFTWGIFKFGQQYCRENGCTGFTNVHRINFSLGVMHLIMAALLVGVKSTRNPRGVIQNGYWISKLFVWGLTLFISYIIPDKFFIFWGNYLSIFFSTCFIGIGLILLVDFAHEWAETCLERIEEGEIYLNDEDDEDGSSCTGGRFWRSLLVGGTLSMYLGTVLLTIVMYIFFARSGCGLNTAAVTVNLVLVSLITGLSVTPLVQEYNPNAGLAQSSMCCVYCTYLVFSACLSEPDDKLCNPLIRSKGTRTISVIVGAVFTFLAVAYTTTRAAGNSAFKHGEDSPYNSVSDVVTSQPSGRSEMRMLAIRQAVDEGSLPESALNDPEYLNMDQTDDTGEEKNFTKYNYFLFHIIFFLATQYIAALLTINVHVDFDDGFVPVGRTYFNTWVKIVSSWVCFALYGWSLVAPVLFPDRF